jgi:putative salt-induced outer membrane protein YdiY
LLLKKIVFVCLLAPVLSYAAPVTLVLTNGDRLQGDLLERNQESLTIKHQLLGEMTISTNTVSEIKTDYEALAQQTPTTEPSTPQPYVEPAGLVAAAEPEDSGLFGTGWLSDWERRFDLGLTGSRGKSDNSKVNVAFNADLATDQTRINSRTAYFYAKSEDETSDNSFFTSINRDWLKPTTPWFTFAGGRLDIDRFKDYDYRVNANAGYGYEFANSEDFLFVGRSGVGFNKTFGGERQEFTPEGLLGLETRWRINAAQRLALANTFYPSFDSFDEYRNVTSFDWILDLDERAGVALKVGMTNEYDSETEDNISKNDFKYMLSLSWSL